MYKIPFFTNRLFSIELKDCMQHSLLNVDQQIIIIAQGILLWIAHWSIVEEDTILPLIWRNYIIFLLFKFD